MKLENIYNNLPLELKKIFTSCLRFTYSLKIIKFLDNVICDTFFKQNTNKILFHGRSVMNFSMFQPIYEHIEQESQTKVFFCFSKQYMQTEEINFWDQLPIPDNRVLTVKQAQCRKWNAVFDADCVTPRFYRTANYIQIFHGVAGKIFENVSSNGKNELFNYNFHPYLKKYNLCLFINKTFCENAKARGLWQHQDSGEVVGMPCLDQLIKHNNKHDIDTLKNKHVPKRFRHKKVFLYAPTWGHCSSFETKGDEILHILSQIDGYIIIKPHPLCISSRVPNTSMTLPEYLKNVFTKQNYLLTAQPPYDFMNIADVLISDFSSLSFEYCLLKKPIVFFVAKGLSSKSVDQEQFELLKESCSLIYEDEPITRHDFDIKPVSQKQLKAMEHLGEKYFANIGYATKSAVNVLKKRNIIFGINSNLRV